MTDKLNKASTKMAVAALAMVAVFVNGVQAMAAPADPGGTGAEFTALGDEAESWVATYGVPVLGALLLVGIGVTLLIRWGKRTPRVVS